MAFQIDLKSEDAFKKEVLDTADTLQSTFLFVPVCAAWHCGMFLGSNTV